MINCDCQELCTLPSVTLSNQTPPPKVRKQSSQSTPPTQLPILHELHKDKLADRDPIFSVSPYPMHKMPTKELPFRPSKIVVQRRKLTPALTVCRMPGRTNSFSLFFPLPSCCRFCGAAKQPFPTFFSGFVVRVATLGRREDALLGRSLEL